MAANCTELYQQHFDSVYNYIYFRLRSIPETEDLVSEIFLKAVAAANTYHWRPGASQKSWLFSIVRNTLIDHFRKRRLDTVELETIEVSDQTNHHNLGTRIDQQDQYQQVLTAIDQLPERQREIVILHYQAQLSHKEIAKLLAITPSAVSAALSKATHQLTNLVSKPL